MGYKKALFFGVDFLSTSTMFAWISLVFFLSSFDFADPRSRKKRRSTTRAVMEIEELWDKDGDLAVCGAWKT